MVVLHGMKVSIQGQTASFHDIAAQKFHGKATVIPCDSFKEAIMALVGMQSDYALVAIENSLYGTINEVYDLILNQPVTIHGEVYLRIEQNLIGLPRTKLNEIKEIHSHPIALAQCHDFIDTYIPKAIKFENFDTAKSVECIKKWNDKSKVAIASIDAAKLHGLEVLNKSIETNKHNFTRFVVLQRNAANNLMEGANKTSLVLQTPKDTKAGSLFHVLEVFNNHKINLSALHSRPIIGKAWHYMFYIDIEIDYDSTVYSKVFDQLKEQGCDIKVLGNYKKNPL